MMQILKGLLGAWKIPYLYFCAWRTWRAQRRNLTTWGRNYNLEPPRFDESNAQYRKRVYAAINGAGRNMKLPDNPLDITPTGLHYAQQIGRAQRPGSVQRMNYPVSALALEASREVETMVEEWEKGGGTVERVDDSIVFSNTGWIDKEGNIHRNSPIGYCGTCGYPLTAITRKCFYSNCPEYMKVQR